jgi:GR25 family glycosyltransferase involved in LPS biosynthesis
MPKQIISTRRLVWSLAILYVSMVSFAMRNNIGNQGSASPLSDYLAFFANNNSVNEEQLSKSGTTVTTATSTLPIFWINLETSTDRRRIMETYFTKLKLSTPSTDVVRVVAHDVARLKLLVDEGRFRLENNITLLDSKPKPPLKKHQLNHYRYTEAACLLSHLDAIRQAYLAGHEIALILEDDAHVTPTFFVLWKEYVSLAPDDWVCLQLGTNNPAVLKQGLQLSNSGDAWVSWQPDHWSTRAYLVNRAAMKNMLSTIHSNTPDGRDIWTLRGNPALVADEVLYLHMPPAYTTTYPWVDAFDVKSTIQSEIILPSAFALHNISLEGAIPTLKLPQRPESILVLGNVRVKTMDEVIVEMKRLGSDCMVVCSMHKVCHWHINMVLTDGSLLADPTINATRSRYIPANLELHVTVMPNNFNKFSFVADFLDNLPKYDLLLFKDNDQRTAGFSWNTFVEKKGAAVIAGPLRQAVDKSLHHKAFDRPKHQAIPLHDAQVWKEDWHSGHTPWSTNLFTTVTPIQVPFLEMYFVLMDGAFAAWFFSQILIPEFVTHRNEWGPDLMWCDAAKEWNPARPSCLLVPIVSKHEDTPRQVETTPLANSNSIWSTNGKFGAWMVRSMRWKELIVGKTLARVVQKCRGVARSSAFSLGECAHKIISS